MFSPFCLAAGKASRPKGAAEATRKPVLQDRPIAPISAARVPAVNDPIWRLTVDGVSPKVEAKII
jgi:hypothetical protein